VIGIFKYEEMREELDKRIPEILKTERYAENERFWGDEVIPIYCYYEALEYLFIDLVSGKIADDELLDRVLIFMEDMANSADREVVNLLVVQILEGLFGIERGVFIRMEKKMLPSTKGLLEVVKRRFRKPNGYCG